MTDYAKMLFGETYEGEKLAKPQQRVSILPRADQVDPELRAQFEAMAEDYFKYTGTPLRVSSSFRTNEEQTRIYNDPNRKYPAAKPGRSRHEFGKALDIDRKQVPLLEDLGLFDTHGFERPVLHKGETWHIELPRFTEAEKIAAKTPGSKDDFDYADALFGGKPAVQESPKIAAGPPLSSLPSGETLPPQNYAPADFGTLAAAATVDKPESKFKVFAKKRFPNLDPEIAAKRYFIKDGDIMYMDNAGTIHKEVGEGFLEAIKKHVADFAGHPLEVIGGIAGAASPVPGGMELGTVAGGAARRAINELAGVEKTALPDYATGAAMDAATALTGRVAGAGINKVLQTAGTAGTGQVGRMIVREPGTFNQAEIARIAAEGRRYGIDLTVPEITGSPTLMSIWANLAKNPKWPNANQKIAEFFKQVRNPQIERAIKTELNEISPIGRDIYEAGSGAQEAAKGVLQKLEGARETATGPLYKQAFQAAPAVDVAPVTGKIDDLLLSQPQGGSGRTALEKIRKMLSTPEGEAETSLEILHNVKIEIDQMLEAAKQDKSISNIMRNKLSQIKGELLGQMDAVSPEYALGRKTFENMSKPITNLRYGSPDLMPRDPKIKTVMQRLIELGPEELEKAPQVVFSSKPEAIQRTRAWFTNNGYDDSWDALVKAHLEQRLNSVAKTMTTQEGNLGYAFRRKVMGSAQEESALKAAMDGPQFARFKGFIDVLDHTSKIVYTNSQTAMQQEATKAVQNLGGGALLRAGAAFSINPKDWALTLMEIRSPGNALKLADVLTNPANAQAIERLIKIPDKVQRAVQMQSFLTAIWGREQVRGPNYTPEPKATPGGAESGIGLEQWQP